jgi:hypothetical protein
MSYSITTYHTPLLVTVAAAAQSTGGSTNSVAISYTNAAPNIAAGISIGASIGLSAHGDPQATATAFTAGAVSGGELELVTSFGGDFGGHSAHHSYALAFSTTIAVTAHLGSSISLFG